MMGSCQVDKLFSRVEVPVRLEDAWTLGQTENTCYVSGGTLLQANWEMGLAPPVNIISLESIAEMRTVVPIILDGEKHIKIGALTTLTEGLQDPLIMKNAGILSAACKNIAAPAVRNRGTLGGNIASGIGDSIPALLALNAKLIIYEDNRSFTVSLEEWLNQRSTSIICSILIPANKEEVDMKGYFRKVGRRETFTAALVTVSAGCSVGNDNRLKDVRLAIGGGQHRPKRLIENELLLEGTIATPDLLKSVYSTIFEEIESYNDTFATAKYRRTVATNLFISFLKECIA
ncbi:MAG: xanthine dehydrogenase FAD-binding subunit [Bacillus sp. (in: firmicutes)]|nr:xanthine dehydrogenase FAD-binding subunit [Bacillus sp. (in: firmicutes)]